MTITSLLYHKKPSLSNVLLSKVNLTIFDKKGHKRSYYTTSARTRRIFKTLASSDAQKYIIKVVYGKHLDNFNQKLLFLNEAECFDKKEAKETLKAFLEIKPEELN